MRNQNVLDIRYIIPSLAIFGLIFLLSSLGFFENFRGGVIQIVENSYFDIRSRVDEFSSISFVFGNITQVKNENNDLKNKVLELESEVARLSKQIDDVAYIFEKGLADFDPKYNLIAARILYFDSDRPGVAYINKGIHDQVGDEDILVLGEYAIAEVTKAYDSYSEILFIGNRENKVNVISLNSKTRGILYGNFTESLEVREILTEAPLELNEIFITEGNDGKYPYGLYVGKVERIIGSPAEPVKTALLSNQIQFPKLDRVYVIKIK